MTKEEAKGVFAVEGMNIFADVTKGIQYLTETRPLLEEALGKS